MSSGVVWAISKFLLLLFVLFISINNLTGINDLLKLWMYLGEATTKRTGPNNAKHVVWAISKFFFTIRVFLYLLIIYLISIGIIEATDRLQ